MRLTQCDAGLMVVEHHVGYSFVFQMDQEAGIDLVDRHWEGVGPAPEAEAMEEEAKLFAAMRVQSLS